MMVNNVLGRVDTNQPQADSTKKLLKTGNIKG